MKIKLWNLETRKKLASVPLVTTFMVSLVFTFCSVVFLSSCGVYSFTGASTDAKNISISDFYNNADLGPANMGQTFTNNIKNYFIQNSSLSTVPNDGQLQLMGEITDFKLTPISPTATAGDITTQNIASATRITISLKVTYINTLDDKLSFKDKTFSFYKDFGNDQQLSDIQDDYVKQIFDRITIDIFNASIANW